MGSLWIVFGAIVGVLFILRTLLKSVNWLLYEAKLGAKQYSLPPGDMGWPIVGNMWSFLRAFKSNDPDSFMASFVKRYKFYHILFNCLIFHHLTSYFIVIFHVNYKFSFSLFYISLCSIILCNHISFLPKCIIESKHFVNRLNLTNFFSKYLTIFLFRTLVQTRDIRSVFLEI